MGVIMPPSVNISRRGGDFQNFRTGSFRALEAHRGARHDEGAAAKAQAFGSAVYAAEEIGIHSGHDGLFVLVGVDSWQLPGYPFLPAA
jgi:hypothetical protein